MIRWKATQPDEQETTINIDYHDKTITLYTSRRSIAQKLEREIGKATKIDYTNNSISGITYKRKIDSKDTKKLLSKGLLVGQIKSNRNQEV